MAQDLMNSEAISVAKLQQYFCSIFSHILSPIALKNCQSMLKIIADT